MVTFIDYIIASNVECGNWKSVFFPFSSIPVAAAAAVLNSKLDPTYTHAAQSSSSDKLITLLMQFLLHQFITVHIDSLGFDMIDMTWFSALLLGDCCLALGYFIGARHSARIFLSPRVSKGAEIVVDGKSKNRGKQLLEIEKLADILEDFKMVLVVRNDLKMGKGKIAAQCSHATLGLYKKLANRAPESLNRWEMCGQVKVVVKIESEDDMLVLQEKAKSLNLQTHITIDAGRTQIAPNSRTVMAVLGPADMVDNVTGGLKLL